MDGLFPNISSGGAPIGSTSRSGDAFNLGQFDFSAGRIGGINEPLPNWFLIVISVLLGIGIVAFLIKG